MMREFADGRLDLQLVVSLIAIALVAHAAVETLRDAVRCDAAAWSWYR
jgi:hypothetical protein